jgi:hypothetical protein
MLTCFYASAAVNWFENKVNQFTAARTPCETRAAQSRPRCLQAHIEFQTSFLFMLTQEELDRIFAWNPYRDDWPVNRNVHDDNIGSHYGELIHSLTHNNFFESYYSEDGGMANYLEFVCFPLERNYESGYAILVCISLCSPYAAYGQTTFHKTNNFFGWGGMFPAEDIGVITDPRLVKIEQEIRLILARQGLFLIDSDLACRPLPEEIALQLESENHNEGRQYLHGIFQKSD